MERAYNHRVESEQQSIANMTTNCKLFIIAQFLLIHGINGWKTFRLTYYNSSYAAPNADVGFNLTITKQGDITAYVDIRKPNMIIYANILFLIESSANKYDMVFMNRSINGCEFLNNKKYEPILQIIFRMAREYGDLPTKCPLDMRLYYIRNMVIDTQKFPPIFPDKKIQLSMTFMTKGKNNFIKPVMMFEVYFRVQS